MTELEKLEKRWMELLSRPNSKEEIEETLALANRLELERAKEIKGLIGELKKVGIEITTIWDLVNTNKKYPEAIEILTNHLLNNYSDQNTEGIVRSLIVKEAKGKANEELKVLYERTPKEKDNLRWVIGYAIVTVMTPRDGEWILSNALDKSNSGSRGIFISRLARVKSEKTEDILIDLLDDNEVTIFALQSLGKLKSRKAKGKIIPFLSHTDSSIRKEAQKALSKIENSKF